MLSDIGTYGLEQKILSGLAFSQRQVKPQTLYLLTPKPYITKRRNYNLWRANYGAFCILGTSSFWSLSMYCQSFLKSPISLFSGPPGRFGERLSAERSYGCLKQPRYAHPSDGEFNITFSFFYLTLAAGRNMILLVFKNSRAIWRQWAISFNMYVDFWKKHAVVR